jgi:hypothetical protein
MTVDSRTSVPDAGEIQALWTGVLLPPIAFLINLEVAYALVPKACASKSTLVLHLVHAVCLGLVLLGGLTAWRCWRATGAVWPGEGGGPLARSRFMAGIGVLMSVFVALVIVADWIPSFMLNPCQ